MIGVLTTHHCHDGPTSVACRSVSGCRKCLSQDKFLPALPRPQAGPHASEVRPPEYSRARHRGQRDIGFMPHWNLRGATDQYSRCCTRIAYRRLADEQSAREPPAPRRARDSTSRHRSGSERTPGPTPGREAFMLSSPNMFRFLAWYAQQPSYSYQTVAGRQRWDKNAK